MVWISCIWHWGCNTIRGWGKRVKTVGQSPFCCSWSSNFLMIFWCPKCTPSKLPMVSTEGGGAFQVVVWFGVILKKNLVQIYKKGFKYLVKLNKKTSSAQRQKKFFVFSQTRNYFLSKSLICVNNSSWVGPAGAFGASSSFFFILFIAFTTIKIAKPMIKKSITVWRKLP